MMDDSDLQSSRNATLGGFIAEQSGKNATDTANGYMSGNAEARGLLNQPENFNEGLSFGDRATSDAIKQKYSAGFNHKESELKNKMIQQTTDDHIRKLQKASDMAGQEVELNRQKAILRWKMEQARRAARGQALGNVLGIVGAGAGAYFGGPQGAMAGYQVGQGAGNAYGSAN